MPKGLSKAPGPDWLSTPAAAAVLGIEPRALYRLIDEGHLPAFRFGRVIRLQRGDVEAFMASSATDGPGRESSAG